MTTAERRDKLAADLQQAQQQATQWTQRTAYLQGQLDLLNELEVDSHTETATPTGVTVS